MVGNVYPGCGALLDVGYAMSVCWWFYMGLRDGLLFTGIVCGWFVYFCFASVWVEFVVLLEFAIVWDC